MTKCLSLKCATFSRNFSRKREEKIKQHKQHKEFVREEKLLHKLLKIRQKEESSFPFNGINLCVFYMCVWAHEELTNEHRQHRRRWLHRIYTKYHIEKKNSVV